MSLQFPPRICVHINLYTVSKIRDNLIITETHIIHKSWPLFIKLNAIGMIGMKCYWTDLENFCVFCKNKTFNETKTLERIIDYQHWLSLMLHISKLLSQFNFLLFPKQIQKSCISRHGWNNINLCKLPSRCRGGLKGETQNKSKNIDFACLIYSRIVIYSRTRFVVQKHSNLITKAIGISASPNCTHSTTKQSKAK